MRGALRHEGKAAWNLLRRRLRSPHHLSADHPDGDCWRSAPTGWCAMRRSCSSRRPRRRPSTSPTTSCAVSWSRTSCRTAHCAANSSARKADTFPTTTRWRSIRPRLRSISPEGLTTRATANRGLSNGDGTEVQLFGNAIVVREAAVSAGRQAHAAAGVSRRIPACLPRHRARQVAQAGHPDPRHRPVHGRLAGLRQPDRRRQSARPRARPADAFGDSARGEALHAAGLHHRRVERHRPGAGVRASIRRAAAWHWWRGARARSKDWAALREARCPSAIASTAPMSPNIDSIVAAGASCIAQQGVPDVVIANAGISVGIDTADAWRPRRARADLCDQQRRAGRDLPSLRCRDGGARQRPAGRHRQRRGDPRTARVTARTAPARRGSWRTARACAANCAPAASRSSPSAPATSTRR